MPGSRSLRLSSRARTLIGGYSISPCTLQIPRTRRDPGENHDHESGGGGIRFRLTRTSSAGIWRRRKGSTPLRYDESEPVRSRLSEKAVVYLESEDANRGKYPPPRKNPVLNQKGLQFHPQVLPILVGTTVDFPNRDNLFHNVFSYSQPREFDLGRYPKDDSRSVTFDVPGTVRVYCDIHTRMSATILVLQHPFFASVGDAGEYLIPNVPPGKIHRWCSGTDVK